METGFKCLHSGRCCEKEYTQINLTIGDLKRIAGFLKIDVKDLFWHYAGMQPFQQEENANVFDLELGLEIPCRFRKNNRCVIYEARPLNCRLFPYWIIANFPKEKWLDILDESYKCVHKTRLTSETKQKYKEYACKTGKILLEESKKTDKIMKKMKMVGSVDISRFKSVEQLSQIHKKLEGIELQKRIDEEKIRICKKLIDKEKFKELPKKLSKEKTKFAAIKEINEIEEIICPFSSRSRQSSP